jgi:hypothetical protein
MNSSTDRNNPDSIASRTACSCFELSLIVMFPSPSLSVGPVLTSFYTISKPPAASAVQRGSRRSQVVDHAGCLVKTAPPIMNVSQCLPKTGAALYLNALVLNAFIAPCCLAYYTGRLVVPCDCGF